LTGASVTTDYATTGCSASTSTWSRRMKVTEELVKLRKHRDALEAFVNGPAHVGYVAARQEELRLVNESILEGDVRHEEDVFEQLKLRGEKRLLENLVNIFPIALEELNDRISTLEDDEDSLGQSPRGVRRSNSVLE
jgi:hypothetical protein